MPNPRRTAAFTAALFLLLTTAAPATAKNLPTTIPCTPGSPITGCTFTPPPAPGSGWVLADRPTSPVGEWYTPADAYQLNHTASVSRSNRVRHDGPGAYTVYVDHVTGGGGVAHVVAYGLARTRCKLVTSYPAGSGEYLTVRCDNLAGMPKDNVFTASFTNLRPVNYEFGYRSGVGGTVHTHNSEAGPVTTVREGTGAYHVVFDGLGGAPGGTAQVTATGQSNSWCKAADWYPDGQVAARHVLVRCFTPAGQPVDSEFNATFVDRGTLVGERNYRPGGLNSQYASITAERTGPAAWAFPIAPSLVQGWDGYTNVGVAGSYLAGDRGYAHVTATGTSPNSCVLAGWDDSQIDVQCYSPTGVPVLTPFTFAYLEAFN